MFLKKGRNGDCGYVENSREDSVISEETIPAGQAGTDCKSLWKKMIEKPYLGKLNVRFDDGELEIEHGEAIEALPDERGRNR